MKGKHDEGAKWVFGFHGVFPPSCETQIAPYLFPFMFHPMSPPLAPFHPLDWAPKEKRTVPQAPGLSRGSLGRFGGGEVDRYEYPAGTKGMRFMIL